MVYINNKGSPDEKYKKGERFSLKEINCFEGGGLQNAFDAGLHTWFMSEL